MEQFRVEVGPDSVYYQVVGEGEPLILVHGLSGSSRWWAKNIEPLAQHFRVYVVDLIGFGGSRGQSRFVLSKAASILAEWMDKVGIERAYIIGHSMGGYISAELTADYPDRVDRLVLVDAAGLPFGCNYLRYGFGLLRALRYLPFDFVPVLLGDAFRAGPLTLLHAMWQLLASDLREKLVQIVVPTLVIWGEYDTVMSVAIGEGLIECLQQAETSEFIVLEGAGHNPMWDRAHAFNRAVLRFLRGEEPVPREAQAVVEVAE